MKRYPTRSEQAIGLVEILVAMGLFLVGITAIVRIFPAGMHTTETTNNRTVASKMAESILSQYEPQLATLGVLRMYSTDNIHPDKLPDEVDPTSGADVLDALTDAKAIVGEKQTVNAGGLILLNFAPLVTGSVTVYQEVLGSATAPILTSPSVTVSAPGANTGDYSRISYAWRDDNGLTYYSENYRVAYTTAAVLLPTPSASGMLVPGSLKAVLEDVLTPTAVDAAFGVLSGLTAGTEVCVNYSVSDWRWINESVALDATGTGQLLFTNLDPANDIHVAWLNPSTSVYETETIVAGNATNRQDDVGTIDPVNANIVPGESVRVSYRTLDEWAMQVYRAPFVYGPAVSGLAAADAWQARADAQWVSGAGTAPQRFVGFRRASAGRGVLIDYNYYNNNTGATPWTKTEVRGEFHRIPVEPTASPTYSAYPYQMGLNIPTSIVPANLQTEIIRVRGATVRARVYWNEDGKWRAVQIERQTPLRAG
jgi:hypothetical protein